MKLDYDYIKQILQVMQQQEAHQVTNYIIMSKLDAGMKVSVSDHVSSTIDSPEQLDKFIGHIRILNDYNCIDCSTDSLGFRQMSNNNWTLAEVNYRLTAQGYEFLDILNDKTILNRIKNLSVSTAWEVGKSLLMQQLTAGAV